METQQKGRAPYVVLALAFAALIVGGTTWFYVNGTKDSPEVAQTTEASKAGDSAAAETVLDASIEDLDNELAAIEVEEESEDDTVDF